MMTLLRSLWALKGYLHQGMCTFILLAFIANAQAQVYPLPKNGDIIGDIQVINAVYEDSFVALSRIYNMAFDEMVAANPDMDPWIPGEGTQVIIPSQYILPPGPRKGIVINLPEMRLYYYLPDGKHVLTHPVGIGKETWPTPTGSARIIGKTVNPAWRVPQTIYQEHLKKGDPIPRVVPAGPDNPLGRYAMRLNIPGYLIHSTNRPPGVGQRISHGCIRMYPEDIQSLFDKVPMGTPVRIIHEPFKAGWHNGKIYMESHEPLLEFAKKITISDAVQTVKKRLGKAQHKINWSVVRMMSSYHSGMPHDVGLMQ